MVDFPCRRRHKCCHG